MNKLKVVLHFFVNILNLIEEDMGKPKQAILEKALDSRAQENLLKKINESYEELEKDPVAWKEELEERAIWDGTVGDGLEDE